MQRSRLEAFSDGVFAVAITLLVFNLVIGGPGHGPLLRQLADHWPSFVAYVISFFTVGIIWVNHHVLMDNITHVDRKLLFLNLFLLLFVVAIPFATGTMADYLTTNDEDSRVAMLLYALVLEGMSLGFAAIFAWSLGEGRTHHPVPPEARAGAWVRFMIGGLVYLVAAAAAFISAPVALTIIGLVAVYYIFEQTPAGRGR